MKEEYISKKFGKLLHIYLSTWTRNIYYINTNNIGEYCKIINSQLDQKCVPGDFRKSSQGNFSVFLRKNIPIGVIRCKVSTLGELMHECLHATFWIMEDVGVELSSKSEEAYCYTQMAIFNEIIKHYNK